MKIINQHNKYINEIYKHDKQITNYTKKVSHMINNGYGSIEIEGKRVSYVDEYTVDGEKFIVVNVGEDQEEEDGL